MNTTIRFFGTQGPYGGLSNFYPAVIHVDGEHWPTVEHYFQAQKFPGTPHAAVIQHAGSPQEAKRLGQSRQWLLRRDWEQVKTVIMYRALEAKYAQHPDLQNLLLSTGEQPLVEASPYDAYWGCGRDGQGANALGCLLMLLRGLLRERGEQGSRRRA